MPVTVAPIFDPQRGFRVWLVGQIYTGTGPGAYVPNVDDLVVDFASGFYRVTGVNGTTGESNLEYFPVANMNTGVVAQDSLLGSGPGKTSESYRVYINTDVTPITAAFDHRLHLYGTAAHHVKLFRGTDTTVTGFVVSAMFDSGGIVITENIPCETLVMPGLTNVGVKGISVGGVIEPLADGETVTCVVYNSTGDVLGKWTMLVERTNFVHTADTSKRFIMGVELITPFMSPSDDHLIEIPMNMLVQSTSLLCRVRYSDATTEDLPIDGNRVRLNGLNSFTATKVGQTFPLHLIYVLQPDEYGYGVSQPLPDRTILERYQIRTIESVGAYEVKLFAVPRWQTSPTAQWVLDWYLYSLERDVVFDVSSLVVVSTATPFNGNAINVRQKIDVSLELSAVDPMYLFYRHVQSLYLTLKASGSNTLATSYWELEYTSGQYFGAGLYAQAATGFENPLLKRVNISQDLVDVEEWMSLVYNKIEPLRFLETEPVPMEPTHVRVKIGTSFTRELTLTNALLWIDNVPNTIVQGMPVRLEFFKRTLTRDFELGVSSMTLRV